MEKLMSKEKLYDLKARSLLLADMAQYRSMGWNELADYTQETARLLSEKIQTEDYEKRDAHRNKFDALYAKCSK